jgi:hypothetical protein
MPPVPVLKQRTSLRLPLETFHPVVRPSPALPADPALGGIARDIIAEAKYAATVAAAEQRDAPGVLYGLMREFMSSRTPAAQNRAKVRSTALLTSSDAMRQLTFGRYAAINTSEYLTVGSTESIKRLANLHVDPDLLRGGIAKFQQFHLVTPSNAPVDPNVKAGLEYKKLRVFIAAVRCVEETDEVGSDKINIGAVKATPFGETNVIDQFTVSSDFDEDEVVNYSGLGHKITGWNLVTDQPWPVSYLVTIAMAEKDDGGFYKFLMELWNWVKEKALALIAAGVGAAVGGALGGIIGAAVGAIVGVLIGWIISLFDNQDDIIGAIPCTFSLGRATKSYYDWLGLTSAEGVKTTLHFKGDGGYYRVRLRYKVFKD